MADARGISGFNPPQVTGQSIMDMDTNDITINRIVGFQWDGPGTYIEDEMPTPTLSPVQNVAPVIPPTETEDSLDRGDGFDLDLAKVMLDVDFADRGIRGAEYAAPATPVLETVIESPGYTVPEEFTWVPGYVPVPKVATVSEDGQTLSTGHPPPNTFPASAATPVVSSLTIDQFLPTMPSPPEDMVQVARTESVREIWLRSLWWKRRRGPPQP